MVPNRHVCGIFTRLQSSTIGVFANFGKTFSVLIYMKLINNSSTLQKADVVVGLREDQVESTKAIDENWMVNGNWGVIQFCPKLLHCDLHHSFLFRFSSRSLSITYCKKSVNELNSVLL